MRGPGPCVTGRYGELRFWPPLAAGGVGLPSAGGREGGGRDFGVPRGFLAVFSGGAFGGTVGAGEAGGGVPGVADGGAKFFVTPPKTGGGNIWGGRPDSAVVMNARQMSAGAAVLC